MRRLNVPDVGAPDPERKNSPIADHHVDEFEYEDLEMQTEFCYFNDLRYPVGDYVCSGNQLLCCEKGGVWVPKGPCHE